MSQSLDPIEETWADGLQDLREKIGQSVGVDVTPSSCTNKTTLEAICEEFDLDTPFYKREMIRSIREAHPELEPRNYQGLTIPEFREIYASIERGEVFGDD